MSLKKAVILSNHFRSFKYISDYLVEFFGPNTDYYICAWDDEGGYINGTKYPSLIDNRYRYSKEYYSKTDKTYLETAIKNFDPVNYKIINNKLLYKLLDDVDFPINKFESKHFIDYTIGGFLPPYICSKMISESKIKYDIIIKARLDIIPIAPPKFNFEKHLNDLSSSSKDRILYTSRFLDEKNTSTLVKGVPYIQDEFFYGKAESILSFYKDIFLKIKKLYGISFLEKKLNRPKINGLLFSFTESSVNHSPLKWEVIRKDYVDSNSNLKDLASFKKIDKIWQSGKITNL